MQAIWHTPQSIGRVSSPSMRLSTRTGQRAHTLSQLVTQVYNRHLRAVGAKAARPAEHRRLHPLEGSRRLSHELRAVDARLARAAGTRNSVTPLTRRTPSRARAGLGQFITCIRVA